MPYHTMYITMIVRLHDRLSAFCARFEQIFVRPTDTCTNGPIR